MPGQAANREWYLTKADSLETKALRDEQTAIALSRCFDPVKKAEGIAAAQRSKIWRRLIQDSLSKACDLTDYDPAEVDDAAWEKLNRLRDEAENRSLRPSQVRSLYSKMCHE